MVLMRTKSSIEDLFERTVIIFEDISSSNFFFFNRSSNRGGWSESGIGKIVTAVTVLRAELGDEHSAQDEEVKRIISNGCRLLDRSSTGAGLWAKIDSEEQRRRGSGGGCW